MTRAREHISMAEARLEFGTTENDDRYIELAKISFLAAIACTLADMADMDADTRTQPVYKPPVPPEFYDLTSPGDSNRIPT